MKLIFITCLLFYYLITTGVAETILFLKTRLFTKRLGLVFMLAGFISQALAQTVISISPDKDLYITTGSIFTLGGLSLTPSSDFTMRDVRVDRSATVNHTLPTVYVSDVYHFSKTGDPFSGLIRFAYNDADLNGLDESALTVAIHDGSQWEKEDVGSHDATNNYIISVPVSGKAISELTLTEAFAILPLHWGQAKAKRVGNQFLIEWETSQEQDISHFSVEKSSDARNWVTVITPIPARNTFDKQHYSAIDPAYTTQQVYYRICERSLNGRSSYSAVIMIAGQKEELRLLAYPNPAQHSFILKPALTGGNEIKSLQLFDAHGRLVRAWKSPLQEYDISSLQAAVYYLHVQTTDNQVYRFSIIKQ